LIDANIESILLTPDHITIVKRPAISWFYIIENACEIIESHFNSGLELFDAEAHDTFYKIEMKDCVMEVLLLNFTNLKGFEMFFGENSDSDLVTDLFTLLAITKVIFLENSILISFLNDENLEYKLESLNKILYSHFILKNGFYNDKAFTSKGTIISNFQAQEKNYSKEELAIIDIINTEIAPSIHMDGGDIKLEEFRDGIVYVRLEGACVGCASSETTLKEGVEKILKFYFPEIKEIVAL